MKLRDSGLPGEICPTSIRRQDLLCLYFYYIGFSRIRNLVFRSCRIPVARFLAFHDVLNHEAKSFRDKLIHVKKASNVISLDDFFAGRMSWKKINVAITFDDGYRGWLDNVFPVLMDLGITATFFVTSGFVELKEKPEKDFLRKNIRSNFQTTGSLGKEQLRKLSDAGFAIGGHTINHTNLSEISNIDEVRYEIKKDKEKLEKITGKKVDYFAYPFGFYQNEKINLVEVLQESGYRGAVTTVPGLNNPHINNYHKRRDLVSASMPMIVFKARLLGNHDGVMFIRKSLRR